MNILFHESPFLVEISSCGLGYLVAFSSYVLGPASCVARTLPGHCSQVGGFIGTPKRARAALAWDFEGAGRRTQDAGREKRQEAYQAKDKRKICRSDTVQRVTVAMEISS